MTGQSPALCRGLLGFLATERASHPPLSRPFSSQPSTGWEEKGRERGFGAPLHFFRFRNQLHPSATAVARLWRVKRLGEQRAGGPTDSLPNTITQD